MKDLLTEEPRELALVAGRPCLDFANHGQRLLRGSNPYAYLIEFSLASRLVSADEAQRLLLAASRRAEWNRGIGEVLNTFAAHSGPDPIHDTIVQQLNADEAESAAYVAKILEGLADVGPDGLRVLVGDLRQQVGSLEDQLRRVRSQVVAVERRLAAG